MVKRKDRRSPTIPTVDDLTRRALWCVEVKVSGRWVEVARCGFDQLQRTRDAVKRVLSNELRVKVVK
jgi:hypothetical protein